MKAFATLGLGPLGSITVQHAITALPADRPHGIASDCWVRLDEKLGLVINPRASGVTGYFMVKHGGTWHKLVAETQTNDV